MATINSNIISAKYLYGISETEVQQYSWETLASDVYFTDKTNLEEKIQDLNADMATLKKSVSDGKTLVATAITNKGVATESDATFDTIATNVDNIPRGGYWTSSPVDMTKQKGFEVIWNKLTVNDFMFGVTSATASANFCDTGWATNDPVGASAGISINKSYNQSTGLLTFSVSGGSASANGADYAKLNVSASASGAFSAYKGTIGGK